MFTTYDYVNFKKVRKKNKFGISLEKIFYINVPAVSSVMIEGVGVQKKKFRCLSKL